MVEVINGELCGIPEGEVIYPLLVSLYADTKIGKTYFGASFPNAVVFDFPPAKFEFRGVKLDPVALKRNVGEGFRSLYVPVRKDDGSLTWKPKIAGFNSNGSQYYFPKTWEQFQTALEKTKYYAEDLSEIKDAGKAWVIIDDTYRWRALEVLHFIETSPKHQYPSQPEFGKITQAMASQITYIRNFANVLVIHRTAKDFDTGEKIPLVYPTSIDFDSDISVKLVHEMRDNELHQVAKIYSTGHDFPCCNSDYQVEVVDPTPEEVLAAAKVPRPMW